MSEPDRMFSYTVGDVIQLRVNLTQEEHLERVTVVYGRDGVDDNTITFAGEVEGTTQVENYARDGRFLPLKESTVVLRMAVDVDHRPGDYHMVHASYLREHEVPGVLETEGDARTPSFRIVGGATTLPSFSLELIDNSAEEQAD